MSFPTWIVMIFVMMFSPFPNFTMGAFFLVLLLVVFVTHFSKFLGKELSKYALILSPFSKNFQVILKQNINNKTAVPMGHV